MHNRQSFEILLAKWPIQAREESSQILYVI